MYRHIFDRSNLDEVVAYNPKTKSKTTRREDLERSPWGGRADIVLFNGTRSRAEYALYVTETGFAGDLWILDMLSDEEYTNVQLIAETMRRNAREFPPAKALLMGY